MCTDDSEQVVLICAAALGCAVATVHKHKLMAEARVGRDMSKHKGQEDDK
jgi:hypothetical protein